MTAVGGGRTAEDGRRGTRWRRWRRRADGGLAAKKRKRRKNFEPVLSTGGRGLRRIKKEAAEKMEYGSRRAQDGGLRTTLRFLITTQTFDPRPATKNSTAAEFLGPPEVR